MLNNVIGREIGKTTSIDSTSKDIVKKVLDYYYTNGLNIVKETDDGYYVTVKERHSYKRYKDDLIILETLEENGFPPDNKSLKDKIIKKCNDDTEIIIHMSDFTGFEWDKCIVYGPSTQTKDICDAFDINYNTYLDLNYGIIFLNNNNVTYEEFFKVSDHDFTNKIPEFIIYPYRQNESTQVKYASFEKNEAEFKCIKKDSDNGYYYRLYPIN